MAMPQPESVAHILVVAPNPDFLRSLSFILKAEGFRVSECAAWPPQEPPSAFDALVIDHAGLDRKQAIDPYLIAMADKSIILASRPDPHPVLVQATVIRKPLLDGALVNTLRAKLSQFRRDT